MSTHTTAAAIPAIPAVRYARLVRGRTYFYKDTEYEFGKLVPINAVDEAYLRANAVDEITLEHENDFILREKFEFFSQEEKDAEASRDVLRQEAADEITQKPRPASRQRTRG